MSFEEIKESEVVVMLDMIEKLYKSVKKECERYE